MSASRLAGIKALSRGDLAERIKEAIVSDNGSLVLNKKPSYLN